MPYEVIAVKRVSWITTYYTIGNPFERTVTGVVRVKWHGRAIENMIPEGPDGKRLRHKTHTRQIRGMIRAVDEYRRFTYPMPESIELWLHPEDEDDMSPEQKIEKKYWGDLRTTGKNGATVPGLKVVQAKIEHD